MKRLVCVAGLVVVFAVVVVAGAGAIVSAADRPHRPRHRALYRAALLHVRRPLLSGQESEREGQLLLLRVQPSPPLRGLSAPRTGPGG
jgi:hypothetical protein